MKVLMVNKFLYPNGGSETYCFSLGRELMNRVHEVEYFGMEHEKNIVGNKLNIKISNVNFKKTSIKSIFYPLKIIYSFESKRKIKKLIESFKPDIIHLNNFNFQITPSILYEIKKHNIPVIMTLHDFQLICPNHMLYIEESNRICESCKGKKYFECIRNKCLHNSKFKSFLAAFESFLYHKLKVYDKYIDYFISPSLFLKKKFIEFGENESKIFVLHNFISTNSSVIATKENYVLYFGRLSIQKGFKTLIQTMKRLPDINFVVAGDGVLKDELSGMNNVEYVGFKNGLDLQKLISEALFSIIPSECYDNCPMAVLESQVLGTPVIGSNIGGIPELIDNNVDGLLFEPGDVNDLTSKIMNLYSNRDRLFEFSRRCVEKAKNFSVEQYYNELIKIYELAISKHQIGS